MRVFRVLAVVSMLSAVVFALAQAPATKSPAAKPAATAKVAAARSAPPEMSEDGNPMPYSPMPAGPAGKQDAELKAIYTADHAWRMTQRGAQEPRALGRIQPTVLPSVDPATQAKALAHYQSVKAQLNKVLDTDISEPERLNLETFRAQIDVLADTQTFVGGAGFGVA